MLTTESRLKLVKLLKEKLEDSRISVRKSRQEEMDNLDDLSEDEEKRAKDEIQKCVDEANKNLETIFEKKEKDIMQ
jgi:ribosome recycling factor